MKKTLEKAPLVHALIHLRFAEVPCLNDISSDMLKQLHMVMVDKGFPEKIISEARMVDLSFDAETKQMRHNQAIKKRNLFRAEGEQEIVEISETSIILKSTNYNTFECFYEKFHSILDGCLEVINGLEKTLIKSVGLRYVDVIAPDKGCSLADFIASEVLPPQLPVPGKHLQGGSVKVIETSPEQVLVVNFEELSCIDRKVHKVLPNDLLEPDRACGLTIEGQQEWLDVDAESYGILDVDHTHNFPGSPKFNIDEIGLITRELYQNSNQIFWNMITTHAKDVWGMAEQETH